MAEQQSGPAKDIVDDLQQHPLTPEEIAARQPKVPELRLRSDVPAVDVKETTLLHDAIEPLRQEEVGSVALRDSSGTAIAMLVPTKRYMELVGTSLANDPRQVATLDGRILPAEQAFAESYVEQADPQETWGDPIPRIVG